ncbi:MAG: hypothetical protein ABMA14_26895, partial [Hyphomonadaceae bacterium]
PGTSGAFDPAKVVMYSVDKETIPEKTPNGGFCDKTMALATYTQKDDLFETLTIAAFNGDQWPPKDDTTLCGTFSYTLDK